VNGSSRETIVREAFKILTTEDHIYD
jgi:hypothetical protein